jgi:hypothetical protein
MVGGIVLLAGTGVAIYCYQRSLDKPGGREGLGHVGDMFGADRGVQPRGGTRPRVAQGARARRPGTPTPDDLDDDPIRLLTNPDGTPRAIRIRRPR